MNTYSSEPEIIRYESKKIDRVLEIEVIPNPNDKPKDVKDRMACDLRNISREAGQDPEDYVLSWLKLANLLLVARDDGKPCGFTIVHYAEPNLIHFPAAMVTSDYQKTGLGTFITLSAGKEFLFQKLKPSPGQLLNSLKPVYFVFRTQNPTLYTILSKFFQMFPPVTNDMLSAREMDLGQRCAKRFWPSCDFDAETFVLRNAYESNPGLMPEPEDIPWSKSQNVNHYFEQHLGLTSKAGHALLVLGKATLFDQIVKVIRRRGR